MTNNPFATAVATAAAQINMAAPDNSEPGPQAGRQTGQPERDLSTLSEGERQQHIKAALVRAYHEGGKPAADALRQRSPDAAKLALKVSAFAFSPKPTGFYDAVGRMVGRWITDEAALQLPNRQDVAALSSDIGGLPRPANELSRDMNRTTLERCRSVFAAKGLDLPASVRTLSGVKAAARAIRAKARPEATPFGTIGTIAAGTLAIGSATFRVEDHEGRDYLRLSVNGERGRLRLDLLTEFLRQSGLLEGQPREAPCILSLERGKSGPDAENRGNAGDPVETFPETWPSQSPTPSALPGNVAQPHDQSPSLSERIARLAKAMHTNPATDNAGTDTLEFADGATPAASQPHSTA